MNIKQAVKILDDLNNDIAGVISIEEGQALDVVLRYIKVAEELKMDKHDYVTIIVFEPDMKHTPIVVVGRLYDAYTWLNLNYNFGEMIHGENGAIELRINHVLEYLGDIYATGRGKEAIKIASLNSTLLRHVRLDEGDNVSFGDLDDEEAAAEAREQYIREYGEDGE